MGPPSYMRSVVDRNVFMRRISVYVTVCMCMDPASSHECGTKLCYAYDVVKLKYLEGRVTLKVKLWHWSLSRLRLQRRPSFGM